jgi:hypothetical protein
MNKEEYIVISKTAIQKRIEELEKEYILLSNKSDRSLSDIEKEREIVGEQRGLATIISQSTPLIPEIEKAFDAGRKLSDKSQLYTPDFHWTKEDYISNLKLDI